MAATPPAARATPRTTRRAAFITLHFPHDNTAGRAVIAGFEQLNVKAWLMRRIQSELMYCCFGLAAAHSSDAERGHPLGLRVNDERSDRERDAVRNAGVLAMQPFRPWLPEKYLRHRQRAELNQPDRQRAAKQRGIDQIVCEMADAQPKYSCRRKLGVSAADPSLRKAGKCDN